MLADDKGFSTEKTERSQLCSATQNCRKLNTDLNQTAFQS